MHSLRFHHVFYTLMALAALCAFVVPASVTDSAKPGLQTLFVPVAKPSRAVAAWVSSKVSDPVITDTRPDQVVRQENRRLESENIYLRAQVEDLAKKAGEMARLGDLQQYCVSVPVVGGHASGTAQDVLSVSGSRLSGLEDGMFVLYSGAPVGTLRSGIAGGQVRLLTDKGFSFTGHILGERVVKGRTAAGPGRPPVERSEKQPVTLTPQPLLFTGAGNGVIECVVPKAQVAEWGLKVDDRVTVDDRDWPRDLINRTIGKIRALRDGPSLHTVIEVTPIEDARHASQVLVLKKRN